MPVLIIDDDRDIRELLTVLLRTRGFVEFKTAENGAEGIAILQAATEAHIILIDLMMPVVNGGEFLRWYQTEGGRLPHRIALMSAGSPADHELYGYPFFSKPFDFVRLFEFIRTLENG